MILYAMWHLKKEFEKAGISTSDCKVDIHNIVVIGNHGMKIDLDRMRDDFDKDPMNPNFCRMHKQTSEKIQIVNSVKESKMPEKNKIVYINASGLGIETRLEDSTGSDLGQLPRAVSWRDQTLTWHHVAGGCLQVE